MQKSSYPGGKSGAGVAQKLINRIPPHSELIVPCLGRCGVTRQIKPADRTIGIDLDSDVLDWWQQNLPGRADLFRVDGLEWLKHRFELYRADRSRVVSRDTATGSGDIGRLSAFVFWDPPYLRSTRKSERDIYKYEMDDSDHEKLLAVALQLPCPVMLCGYDSELYRDVLSDWRLYQYTAQTRRGPATESVWMNYPEPAELHDYSFLGDDRRERERIAKRRRNWREGLLRMSDYERNAVLSEIAQEVTIAGESP